MDKQFLDLAIRVLQRGGYRMLDNFLAATRAFAVAGRWNELNKFWALTERFEARNQATINAIYTTATKTNAKIKAALNG
jgi:hypothetical protein